MWNPLNWFRRRSPNAGLDIPTIDTGNEAHEALKDAERGLDEAKRAADKVDRLVRRTPQAYRDRFAQDLYKAFGSP